MTKTSTEKFFTVISEVFSPFVLAGLLLTLIAVQTVPSWGMTILICWTFIIGIPQALSIYMTRANITTDRFIQVRKQRTPFFIVTLGSMLIGVGALNLINTSQDVKLALNLAVGSLIAVIIINLKIKISLHAFVAALFAYVAPLYATLSTHTLFRVLGLLIWALTVCSRYYLKRHSALELVLGTLGGLIVGFLYVFLWA